jgi:hypothetical protein
MAEEYRKEIDGEIPDIRLALTNLSDRKMEGFKQISPYLCSNICPECRHQRILLTDGGNQYIDVFMGHRVKMPTP